MVAFLTTLHVLDALVLILVVLLQSARGTDLAGAFGGMGSQTAFGPRGTTTFLSKTTAVLAGLFMVTSLSLAILSNRSHGRGGSVLSGEKEVPIPRQKQPAPQPPVGQPSLTVTPPPGLAKPDVTVTPAPQPKPSGSSGAQPGNPPKAAGAQGQPDVTKTPDAPPKTSQ